jgi:hypothetical protein
MAGSAKGRSCLDSVARIFPNKEMGGGDGEIKVNAPQEQRRSATNVSIFSLFSFSFFFLLSVACEFERPTAFAGSKSKKTRNVLRAACTVAPWPHIGRSRFRRSPPTQARSIPASEKNVRERGFASRRDVEVTCKTPWGAQLAKRRGFFFVQLFRGPSSSRGRSSSRDGRGLHPSLRIQESDA